MNVIANRKNQNHIKDPFVESYVSKEELYGRADVISIHCDLNESTIGMINSDTIDKMKDEVIIINTSRGSIIKENDLSEALNSGKVYAAGLDSTSEEPVPANNPLLKARNCIITPHIAAASRECMYKLISHTYNNLITYLEGKPINVVKKQKNIIHGMR